MHLHLYYNVYENNPTTHIFYIELLFAMSSHSLRMPVLHFPAPGRVIHIDLVGVELLYVGNGTAGGLGDWVVAGFCSNAMNLEDSRVLVVIAISLSTFHEKLFAFQCNFTACSINLHKFLPGM